MAQGNEDGPGRDSGPDTASAERAERDPKTLPAAAQRALAEAEARRKALAEDRESMPKERGGRREGPEPTRYGDWEKNGILSDF